MDFESLPCEEQCRNGAVDSTTHSKQNGWTRHSEGIVLGRVSKGLEVWRAYFTSMKCEIVDIFGILGMLFDPAMRPHIAHAMEMSPVLNRDGRCSDVSDQDPLFQNLDLFRGCDRTVDFSAGQ